MQKRPGRPSDRLFPGLSEEQSVARARARLNLRWGFASTAGGKGVRPSREARDEGNPRADVIELCERMWVLATGKKLKRNAQLRRFLDEFEAFETWLTSRPPTRGHPLDIDQTLRTVIAICGVDLLRASVQDIHYKQIKIGPGAVGDVWQVLFDEKVTRSAMKGRAIRAARLVREFAAARPPAAPGEKRDDRLRKAVDRLTIK